VGGRSRPREAEHDMTKTVGLERIAKKRKKPKRNVEKTNRWSTRNEHGGEKRKEQTTTG